MKLCGIMWMNSNDMAMSLDIISTASKVKSLVVFFLAYYYGYEL